MKAIGSKERSVKTIMIQKHDLQNQDDLNDGDSNERERPNLGTSNGESSARYYHR